MMLALKGQYANFPDQVNLKEFRRIFEVTRFGQKASKLVQNEFKQMNKEFAHKQYVQIIGGQIKAELASPSKSPSKNITDLTYTTDKFSLKSVKATDERDCKLEMMKSMHDLENKNPTMSQKLNILEKWFVA